MSNLKKNNIFEKTSFLGSNNSQFIEQLYADYLETPDKIPIEWKVFFEGLNAGRNIGQNTRNFCSLFVNFLFKGSKVAKNVRPSKFIVVSCSTYRSINYYFI